MIGHKSIIELRMTRRKPSCVFVTVGPEPMKSRMFLDIDHEMADGASPRVITGDTRPTMADLRFLHGLTVVLDHAHATRADFWQWFDAIALAKPAVIHAYEPDGEAFSWPE